MASVIEPDDIDFSLYLEETEAQQKVKPASVYVEDMLHWMFTPNLEQVAYLPWKKAEDAFQFRRGEVTLWVGINGHGKSLVTGQAALSLMGQGQRVCIASFEMKPRKTLERMSRQWSGQSQVRIGDHPDIIESYKEVIRQFSGWTDSRLWLYDQQGTVKPETIIAVTRYCAKELGIQHMFIDSLMKCVRGEDDYNGQKYLVDELCAIAKDYDMHIHLIHHIKKLQNEGQTPGKFDAKGSGAITDQVDNMLIHWRNKPKEGAIKRGEPYDLTEPDALLICAKQRNGEDEPLIHLWLDKDTHQFVGTMGEKPVNFDSWPHRPWS